MQKETKKTSSSLKTGAVSVVKINSLLQKNMGLAELGNGFRVFVPKASLGMEAKIKIQKVGLAQKTAGRGVALTGDKYALGTIVEVLKEGTFQAPVKVGETLTAKCTQMGPRNFGIVEAANGYKVFVPNFAMGQTSDVTITRLKEGYAFGKLTSQRTPKKPTSSVIDSALGVGIGTKFNIVLPKTAKFVQNHVVVKIQNRIFFIKLNLDAKLGDKVQVQILKTGEKFGLAQVVKKAPMSKIEKQAQIKRAVQKMLKTGLHFGEKAVKCHAKMKKFIWFRKKGAQKNKPLVQRQRHLINVLKTRHCLMQTLKQIGKYAAKGRTFFFVGTKKSAAGLVARAALLTQTSFFVNTRWLGGMLTNWKTILKSISKIRPILKEKQRIMKTLLLKRQRIENHLLLKVQHFKQKSQKLIQKGQQLIAKVKGNKTEFLNQTNLILKKRQQLLDRGQNLLEKQTQLITQRQNIIEKSAELQEKAALLMARKNYLLTQYMNSRKKFREFQVLLVLSMELQKIKANLKAKGQSVVTISSADFNKIARRDFLDREIGSEKVGFIPNPPKEILNKLISTMRQKYNQTSGAEFSGVKAQATGEQIVFSKLLSRFTTFVPFLKASLQQLKTHMNTIQQLFKGISQNLEDIHAKLTTAVTLIQRCSSELQLIQTKFTAERKALNVLRVKLQQIAAEQRLLRFLPKLRCLPTPESQLRQTVQVLMKKFVDPKMIYPIDKIYDQKIQSKSKKVAATRKKKWQRLEKYFGGVTKMAKLNTTQIQQNVAIIIGQREEMNAVLECQKLGMKIISVVDTNCNPGMTDHFIPANDDSRTSLQYVLTKIVQHIRLAQKLRRKVVAFQPQKKRSTRMKRA